MEKIWRWKYNFLRLVYEAFFCVLKNGDQYKSFSIKKTIAFMIIGLAIYNHVRLELAPKEHWVAVLTKSKVHYSVIIALQASLDALAGYVLNVYYKAKKDNAA